MTCDSCLNKYGCSEARFGESVRCMRFRDETEKKKDCKDCLHYNACLKMAIANNADEFNTLVANKCEDYADRSKWVKLPCRVGTVVYEVGTDGRIYGCTVRKIIYETPGISFDDTAIGKSVFLTLGAAERALAEKDKQ